MIRLLLAACLCLGVSGVVGPTAAADDAQWKTIDETQSRLFVGAASDPVYGETGWDASYSRRTYRAVKSDTSPSDPRLEVYYFELAPGRFFPVIRPPQEQIKYFHYFQSGYSIIRGEEHTAHKLRMRHILVVRGARQCLVFVGAAGDGAGDGQTSDGTAYLAGYYCNPAEVPLVASRVEEVLSSIGLKPVGQASPVATVNRTAPRPAQQPAAVLTQTEPAPRQIEKELQNAKSLYERKLISEDEYAAIRKRILGLN